MHLINASLINFTTISLTVKDVSEFNIKNFSIKNGELLLYVEDYKISREEVLIRLKSEVNIKRECYVLHCGIPLKVNYHPFYSSEEFEGRFYTGEELGCIYTPNHSVFKVWSPVASYVNLLIYQNGDPDFVENPKRFKMTEEGGLWKVRITGNLKGYYYTYQLKIHGEVFEAVDPYARAVGVNGARGAVIDLSETDPKGFSKDISPFPENYTDAVIYETSVRDISMHPDSGIRNKGKYLGMVEENTASGKGLSTGLSHIKELGVTHVQFMPVFDFSSTSMDEKNPYKYNWGYDPTNYNIPEGSYSTDPYYPPCRIYEFKKMVQQLHRNKICVIMDVVYNHLFHNTENSFHKTFPGYYFRYDSSGNLSDGSGCGNDTASEKSMMRRFIVDSVLYWTKEYHIDGFRLDLMGLLDFTTVNLLRQALNKIDRRIMLYGEGWNLNTELVESERANLSNNWKLPHIGHFNDIIRDGVKGSVFFSGDRGFVSGKEGLEGLIRRCITGCTVQTDGMKPLFQTPDQSINYVSSHDNHTLWDKLELSCPEASFEELKSMSKLSEAIVLTSQGIPFLHSGAEFCRTKGGISNSYNSTDAVNRMDWNRKLKFLDVVEYYKGLIQLRKSHAAFRMTKVEQIREHLVFLQDMPQKTVGYILRKNANNDSWKNLLVIYNANRFSISVKIPQAGWNIVSDKHKAGTEVLRSFSGSEVSVESLSMLVMYTQEDL